MFSKKGLMDKSQRKNVEIWKGRQKENKVKKKDVKDKPFERVKPFEIAGK